MALYDNKVLNGEHLSYLIGLIKTSLAGKQSTIDSSHKLDTSLVDTNNGAGFVSATEKSTWNGKQDALVFNTTYNATSNKVATMGDIPDISGKQDALVFNTTYNSTSNKVATMSDIPDISGKQDVLEFNSAYNATTNKVATMNDISGKQDELVFNTAYNASTNKVATMSDLPTNTSQLTNGAGFQTADEVATAIQSALGGLTTFHFEVVSTLPASNPDTNAIYLVAKSTASTNNIYEEWAWVKTGTENDQDVYGWEHIGDTQVDIASLSNTEIQTIWESVS